MAKQIKTSITINASKEKIWKTLTDFESYPEWNSFIKSVTGEVKVGNQIKIKLQGMTLTKMIDRFLKAKHWQLFTLMIGIPIIFQIVMIGTMFLNINSETNPDPTEMFNMFKSFPIIMILYMGVFFGWFWSIAIGLQNKVPEKVTMKTKKFKIFFFIPLVYILCISLFIGGIFSGIIQSVTEPSGGLLGGMVGIILPLHLLSIFGIFYSMYFAAKTFKTVELQKEVSFGDFAGEFLMLWFYFIGIWILQPKINKMAESENTTANNAYN